MMKLGWHLVTVYCRASDNTTYLQPSYQPPASNLLQSHDVDDDFDDDDARL